MQQLLIVLRLLSLDPREATLAAAKVAGWPELGPELVKICKRESPGQDCRQRVGLHLNNTPRAIRSFYRKAVAHGWLDPEHCPEHRATTLKEMERFAVRGNHGLAAAYSLRFLAAPCAAPALPGLEWVAERRKCSGVPFDVGEIQVCCSEPPPEACAAHRPREQGQRNRRAQARAPWDTGSTAAAAHIAQRPTVSAAPSCRTLFISHK